MVKLQLTDLRARAKLTARRISKTLPFSLTLAVVALPAVQFFGKASWDEATTAVAVPMFVVYAIARLCVTFARKRQAEIPDLEAEINTVRREQPVGIDSALTVAVVAAILSILSLASGAIYMLLGLRFAGKALYFARNCGMVVIAAIGYIGLVTCLRGLSRLISLKLLNLTLKIVTYPSQMGHAGRSVTHHRRAA